jgi:hypothetical protein
MMTTSETYEQSAKTRVNAVVTGKIGEALVEGSVKLATIEAILSIAAAIREQTAAQIAGTTKMYDIAREALSQEAPTPEQVQESMAVHLDTEPRLPR